MYFQKKNTLKNNFCHNDKHYLKFMKVMLPNSIESLKGNEKKKT
jgi:hypothetical protein